MGARVTGAVITALVTLTVITGCGSPQAADPPDSSGPTATHTVVLPEGLVVATGTFEDSTGHVTGDLTIAAAPGSTFTLSIAGFSSSIATAELSASGEPISADQRCFTEPWRMGFGTHGDADVELEIPLDDPSFIAAIAVTTLPVESSADCTLEYVGFANLTWDIPDLRPDLVVDDTGAADDAQGSVELDEDGAPLSYTAAEGDRLNPIATRFGITTNDLRYLNPTHPVFGGSTLTVPAGEVLNLSKHDR